jgi:hypothetical protein
MLQKTIQKYQNHSLDTAEIIAELVNLAKNMREAQSRGDKLKMSDEEIAFYHALEVNNSVVKVLGDQRLRQIALELVDAVRKWVGDPDASAYELLFSFPSPEEKNEFLNLVRSNEDMGNDYIIEFTPPTTEEIRSARPLATVLYPFREPRAASSFRLIADSHPLPLDLGGQSGETTIENVSALSRVALGCVGPMPWG